MPASDSCFLINAKASCKHSRFSRQLTHLPACRVGVDRLEALFHQTALQVEAIKRIIAFLINQCAARLTLKAVHRQRET